MIIWYSGLLKYSSDLGFNLVGYGCTTCIGNSGDLDASVADAITENGMIFLYMFYLLMSSLVLQTVMPKAKTVPFFSLSDVIVASVLSGNRNFEGRIHPLTRAYYLASPPLVVAYALAGTVSGNILNLCF